MEKNVSKKKPDNVADNPGILPYGSNVGAPAIKPTNISSWKEEKVISTNHYFKTRFDEIKEEYIKLMQEYEWNKLVYDAKYNFTPILGHTYYLYQHEEGYLWLSLVEPEQWDQIYVGAFKLTSNDKWEKVDE
tara:strand:+ start:150 stop:545 length:396 start_codon:yes stop_codon:yes gene_type:complete